MFDVFVDCIGDVARIICYFVGVFLDIARNGGKLVNWYQPNDLVQRHERVIQGLQNVDHLSTYQKARYNASTLVSRANKDEYVVEAPGGVFLRSTRG